MKCSNCNNSMIRPYIKLISMDKNVDLKEVDYYCNRDCLLGQVLLK